MCGLLGIVGNYSNELERKVLSLKEGLNYRGPDETNLIKLDTKYNKKLIFIHNRLSILDHQTGTQPMKSQNGSMIIFNGEIYNHNFLREELKNININFNSSSDTEVILKGYEIYGNKISSKLNGMWSFAIYDKKKEKIFISRDRLGEKPFFYSFLNECFIFSSEEWILKKILSNAELNIKNIAKYCALGFLPENLTPYDNIYSLKPGFNLEIDLRVMTKRLEKFWEFKLDPDYSKSEKYWVDNLYGALENSVNLRLNADTEVGTFLSGGLDSSLITYFAGKKRKDLKTFSINFKDKEINEKKYINFFQDKILKTDHYNLEFDLDNSQNIFENFQSMNNELLSDSSLLSYYVLCKNASKKVKVILGGDGSDELLAGYKTFKAMSFFKLMIKYKSYDFFKHLSKYLDFLPSFDKNLSTKFLINRFFKASKENISLANAIWLSPLNISLINKIFSTNFKETEIYEEIINEWEKYNDHHPMDNTLYFYINFFLKSQTLRKTDRVGMYNSLEIRSPFLDNDVINLISKIPHNLKYKNGTNKYILKKLAIRILPKDFVYRKKIGLTTPIAQMIERNKIDFNLKSSKNITREARKLLTEQNNNFCNNRLELWNLKILDNFLTKNNEKI